MHIEYLEKFIEVASIGERTFVVQNYVNRNQGIGR
jgi:hypothetical protein